MKTKKTDMYLVIDIGNTYVKLAFYRDRVLEALWSDSAINEADMKCLIEAHRPVAGIISSVRGHQDKIDKKSIAGRPTKVLPDEFTDDLKFLAAYDFPIVFAGAHLRTPLSIRYKTPETLGGDRLAAAVASLDRFPGQHLMIINAGTCLTADFVSSTNEYLGGTIAPGLRMRLKAMHEFTGQLPKVTKIPDNIPIVGASTTEAMLSGAVNGMIAEIEGLIKRRQKEISFFNVILSGGDVKFFAKKLKSRIFAVENIVIQGLNLMLKNNVQYL